MGCNKNDLLDRFSLPDLITSLLYASAVSTVLSIAVKSSDNDALVHLSVFTKTFIVVLLIFVDWYSRVFIPTSFSKKQQDRSKLEYQQLLLEILSITALVLFFKQFVGGDNELSFLYFGLYLMFCWSWNFVTIKEIFPSLFKDVFTGKVVDNPGLMHYIEYFITEINNNKDDIAKAMKELADKNRDKNRDKNSNSIITNFEDINKRLRCYKIKYSKFRLTGQFMASHLTWVNLVIGIFLVCFYFIRSLFCATSELLIFDINIDLSHLNYFLPFLYLVIFVSMFVVALLLLAFISWVDTAKKNYRTIFALLILLEMIFVYISCRDYIITIMIFQQIVVGYLLKRMTFNNKKNSDE